MNTQNPYHPLFPTYFKKISGTPTEPAWTPVIVLRDMEFRLHLKNYKGKERRHKMVLSTWLGPSAGFLNPEPHWIKYAPLPELSNRHWKIPELRPPSGLLLLFIPYNCPVTSYMANQAHQSCLPAGFHFGLYADKERKWKAYYRTYGVQVKNPQTWPILPIDAVKKWHSLYVLGCIAGEKPARCWPWSPFGATRSSVMLSSMPS